MSFGGSVSAMLTTLKNNSRGKRKTYFDRSASHSRNKNKLKNPLLNKKATPEQLAEIRNSMIKENHREKIKNLVIVFICILIVISVWAFIGT